MKYRFLGRKYNLIDRSIPKIKFNLSNFNGSSLSSSIFIGIFTIKLVSRNIENHHDKMRHHWSKSNIEIGNNAKPGYKSINLKNNLSMRSWNQNKGISLI